MLSVGKHAQVRQKKASWRATPPHQKNCSLLCITNINRSKELPENVRSHHMQVLESASHIVQLRVDDSRCKEHPGVFGLLLEEVSVTISYGALYGYNAIDINIFHSAAFVTDVCL